MRATGDAIVNPLVGIWDAFVANLPGFFGAIVTIIIGYVVAIVIGGIVKTIITRTRIDIWLAKTGASKAIGGLELSLLGGKLAKWWIFLAFFASAVDLLLVSNLAVLMQRLAMWLPHLVVGIIFILAGLLAAFFLEKMISSAQKLKGVKMIGTVVRFIVIIFFLGIALKEMGIDVTLVESTFLIIIGGITLAAALALGIGFGLGLSKHADKMVHNMKRRM